MSRLSANTRRESEAALGNRFHLDLRILSSVSNRFTHSLLSMINPEIRTCA